MCKHVCQHLPPHGSIHLHACTHLEDTILDQQVSNIRRDAHIGCPGVCQCKCTLPLQRLLIAMQEGYYLWKCACIKERAIAIGNVPALKRWQSSVEMHLHQR
eukprot:scaffold29810_cov19-Tisochrysis_lutea.AAC.1